MFISTFRAIDINVLIGNIGGYVGLLLGVSILQAPEALSRLFGMFSKFYRHSILRSSINILSTETIIGNCESVTAVVPFDSEVPPNIKNELASLKVENAEIKSRLDRLEKNSFK